MTFILVGFEAILVFFCMQANCGIGKAGSKEMVLHISNTNINHDGRILKEMEALEGSDLGLSVLGFGVHQEEDKGRIDFGKERDGIVSRNLFFEKFDLLPRSIKYVFMLIEFTLKAFKYGLSVKPEIVHSHDTFALPACTLIKIFTGAKLIYDAHELESNKNGQSKLLSRVTLTIEKMCWSRVDGFITVSGEILDWYRESFSDKPSAVVLNTPKSVDLTQKSCASLRKKFDIPEDVNIYIYVGILAEGRGIEEILDAFAGDGPSRVVFLGYGSLRDRIQEIAKANTRVCLHEPVSHDEVVSVIKSADYGFCLIEDCSLSDYFSLPNKLFEYAQAGVSVLGSPFPEISRVLEEYSLGYVVENNSDGIKSIVKELDSGVRECQGKNIYDLSWESQVNNLVGLYKKL